MFACISLNSQFFISRHCAVKNSPVSNKFQDVTTNLRKFSTVDNVVQKKVIVITGGDANMASPFVEHALNNDYRVYRCINSNSRYRRAQGPDDLFEVIDRKDLMKVDVWKNILHKASKGASSISLINTIGTSVAPKGYLLSDINEKPITAALDAISSLNIKTSIANISSIAATYFPEKSDHHISKYDEQAVEYCMGRKNIDSLLLSSKIPTLILRPGFVFNAVTPEGHIFSGHDYSPEQFTQLSFHPIVGSGQQKHQPVFIEDLVQAVFNGLKSDKNVIINAVGSEALSQENMIKIFLKLANNKPFKPISIPYEVSSVIAKHFPKGRLAPYAISLLHHLEEHDKPILCHKDFEELVGKPLATMSHTYELSKDRDIFFEESPIVEHIKEIFAICAKNSKARKDLFAIATKYGLSFLFKAITSSLS